jgi:phospholipase C
VRNLVRSKLAGAVAGTALLAGGIAAAGAGSAHAQSAGARGAQSPVRHIVVLYLENHSFDNVLGYWCDAAKRCLGMPSKVTLKGGVTVKPGTTPDTVPQVNHGVRGQEAAIDGGKMDGWASVAGCQASTHYACVSGYQPSHIPNETALAQQFAVSDETFSMRDSPSFGGHLYAVTPTIDGFWGNNPVADKSGPKPGPGWGCDSFKVTPWVSPAGRTEFVPSCIPDPALSRPNGGAFKPTPVRYVPTIMDRLQSAGRTWRIYGYPYPRNYNGGESPYDWSICPSFAECRYTSQDKNLVPSDQFTADARAGRLPAFSVVVPGTKTTGFSQHNHFSMAAGDNWIGQVASAVMHGPQWRSTVLFITYDDCGCFYDQVRPGKNPDGTGQGPRVPLVIVSPYARPHYTDTAPTTFAGILAYVEHTFHLTPVGVNDARAYDFSRAFNYAQAPLRPVRMVWRHLPASALHVPLRYLADDPTGT